MLNYRDKPRKPFHGGRRSGLAPLEMILVLPLHLMLLALMIIVGSAAAWKVRTTANSRQAVVRGIWPRDGVADPKPANWWPRSASMSFADATPPPFDVDPFADHPVVRGPTVGNPISGRSLRVIDQTLDMRTGLIVGRAAINHEPPLWAGLGERNRFSRATVVLGGQLWTHGAMGIPNITRRILTTYDYNLRQYNPGAAQRMQNAADRLLSNPDRPALAVLDRDDELRGYYGDPYTPYDLTDRYDSFDFHPPFHNGCTADPVLLADLAADLIDRIRGNPDLQICSVAERLALAFLGMYQQQLNALLNQNPRPPGSDLVQADLERKIRQLQEFLMTLPNQGRCQ